VRLCDVARAKGAALHLDGARLWQCGPFYGRELAEVAELFDSVYVSFYKDLRAGAGCALAGDAGLVAEARVWQVRHGGRMFSVLPLLLGAEQGLDELLPRMPELVAYAKELAAAVLSARSGLHVLPDPPQTAMFRLLQPPSRVVEWTVSTDDLERPADEVAADVLQKLDDAADG
jgi:threonine aldolase